MAKNDKQSDWISFFSGMVKTGRLSALVGVLFVIALSFFLVYFGSKRAAYADQFYSLVFKVNFLEGLSPGMKVRYQGGVTVGEIDYIESAYHQHFLHARIKKDFKIVKKGSRVVIRSQGVMGQSYIDVSSYAIHFDDEAYEPGDIVSLEEIVPDQVIVNQIASMMEKNEAGLTPLDIKLSDVQSMIRQLRSNDYFNPRTMKVILGQSTNRIYSFMNTMRIFSTDLYNQVMSMDSMLSELASSLRKSVPQVSQRVGNVHDYLHYTGQSNDYNFFHDEFTYDTIMMQIKIINDKLELFKEEPHRIIYN